LIIIIIIIIKGLIFFFCNRNAHLMIAPVHSPTFVFEPKSLKTEALFPDLDVTTYQNLMLCYHTLIQVW